MVTCAVTTIKASFACSFFYHISYASVYGNTMSKTSGQCGMQVDGLADVSETRANKLLELAAIDIPGSTFTA
jgi:hypothetical protein